MACDMKYVHEFLGVFSIVSSASCSPLTPGPLEVESFSCTEPSWRTLSYTQECWYLIRPKHLAWHLAKGRLSPTSQQTFFSPDDLFMKHLCLLPNCLWPHNFIPFQTRLNTRRPACGERVTAGGTVAWHICLCQVHKTAIWMLCKMLNFLECVLLIWQWWWVALSGESFPSRLLLKSLRIRLAFQRYWKQLLVPPTQTGVSKKALGPYQMTCIFWSEAIYVSSCLGTLVLLHDCNAKFF